MPSLELLNGSAFYFLSEPSIYLVDLLGTDRGPIIVTAMNRDRHLDTRCPNCLEHIQLEKRQLGQEVTCPTGSCGMTLRVNTFVLRPYSPGNQDGLQASLGNQSVILQNRGDLDGAMTLHKEQEQICRELGDSEGLARSLVNQAALPGNAAQVQCGVTPGQRSVPAGQRARPDQSGAADTSSPRLR
jgi:hypothetical protein